MKEYETKVLDAEEKIVEIERRLFAELRVSIAAESRRIRQSALALAEIDVLLSFAHLAALHNYCRPEFDDSTQLLEILEGRHPVIEQPELTGSNDRFVPNDLYLDAAQQSILLITGPNMGGKSTYLRQTALIVLMAQMGSFVPATRARLSTVDRIFTRIGASDNLARGRSTFMVEMTETAAILNTATRARSSCSTRSDAAPPPTTASPSPGPSLNSSTAQPRQNALRHPLSRTHRPGRAADRSRTTMSA